MYENSIGKGLRSVSLQGILSSQSFNLSEKALYFRHFQI